MKIVTSVSGGQTSAYLASNYKADHLLFSLVRIEDKKCRFPDEKVRREVEDRIQKPFVATAEDDTIIYTMLDLEQYLGQKINWVSGITFDEVVKTKGGWLPTKLHRYCTTWMKINPMFYWWAENIGTPIIMQIGYRANETHRAKKMIGKLNSNGFSEFEATFEKHPNGRNKWEIVEWQKPIFPLIEDQIYRDNIVNFWKDKPVRFAELNNCVGCFHKHPLLLRKMFEKHPLKMEWFNCQEKLKMAKNKKANWRSDVTYEQIKNSPPQHEINLIDFSDCDSGYCGI